MNKEILKQVLLELTEILSKQEWIEEATKPISWDKTEKQILRSFKNRTNAVCKKYDVIKDLIKQI